ncbi:MAG TPA: YggS family pyridoxal phosphate-dependent enzyme [Vicinamibacterales bacterium]|nr:YggS family pyridoxal phosphate-dependent enzyme [Vicinamibacterales bacterium]
MITASDIAARLNGVRDRIAGAAGRAGRLPSSVRLVAVSKTFPIEAVRAAAACDQVDYGENKVQEGQSKILAAGSLPLRWHLIGHLQSNKAKKAAALFDVIHSIDSVDLLRKVDQGAAERGRRLEVLIQVDLAGESTKHGADESEVAAIIEAAMTCNAAHLTGLMTLPPAVDDPGEARSYFAALRALRDRHVAQGVPPANLVDLSMGMSHDFEVAIEEGATLVRVGSAIFGERSNQRP